MFSKLYQLIIEVVMKMAGMDKTIDDIFPEMNLIDDSMQEEIDRCRRIYKDNADWLNYSNGVYSLGIAKTICSSIATSMLTELKTDIVIPGGSPKPKSDKTEPNNRAEYLNKVYQEKLVEKLPRLVEKALALGGVVIKPYVSNGKAYFDFTLQGDFVPLAFDDDGVLTDVAFVDQFTVGNKKYTKIERQIFDNNKVTIYNKAYVSRITNDNGDIDTLGVEIPLSKVTRWAGLEEEVTIENVSKPLYGYYRTPIANNVDMNSPLGLPIFSPAIGMIERADRQFSRLDWEYEGGQIAIDVDADAVNPKKTYYGTSVTLDSARERLYRRLDLGKEDTYKAFTPQLRDASFKAGLNSYFYRIEDQCGLARGTLADQTAEARTATELMIVKQRSQKTISNNQNEFEKAMRDAMSALEVYIDLYNLVAPGEWVMNVDWKDNVLTDTSTELDEKLRLVDKNILSRSEVRAWYNGEDIETAKKKIEEISESGTRDVLNDLFTDTNLENTLERGNDVRGNDVTDNTEPDTATAGTNAEIQTNLAKADNLR